MPIIHQRLFIYFNLWLLLILPGSLPAWVDQSSPLPNSFPNVTQPTSAGLMFIENVGQFEAEARFVLPGNSGTFYLSQNALWLTALEPSELMPDEPRANSVSSTTPDSQPSPKSRKGVNLKLSFPGANPNPRLEPFQRLDTRVSYFIGNDPAGWRPDVPVWGGVRYVDLYPGVDLEVIGQNGQLVPRLVVRDSETSPTPNAPANSPEAKLKAIRLHVDGADNLALTGDALRMNTAMGSVVFPLLQPVTDGGNPLELPATSPKVNGHEISAPFAPPSTASVAPARTFGLASPLIMPLLQSDPDLVYSTLLGSGCWYGGYGYGCDITVDSAGNSYVTGLTNSSNFPVTAGAFDTSYNGGFTGDIFVAKINATGSGLVYATFLGGNESDIGYAIAIDNTGNAYIGGETGSSNFPATNGAFDTTLNGSNDAFVAKLNAAGTGLTYATFLGGTGSGEHALDIAVDSGGSAYLVGNASFDFPTTSGAFDTSTNDAFVAKLNVNGSGLVYSTFLGGDSWDEGRGIAVDSVGNAYVTGGTSSNNFPTHNPLQATRSGGYDAFVTKLNAGGSALLYSTYLGGSINDNGNGIALDSAGNIYVAGDTFSTDFPTINPLQADYGGHNNVTLFGGDAFVAKLNASGSTLMYSTYLGGSEADAAQAIATDSSGNAYITGLTQSANFPTTAGAFDTIFGGGTCVTGSNTYPCPDAFVVELNPDGISDYATFLGGGDRDEGLGITVDGAGNLYLAGFTYSDFPTTSGAFDTSSDGIDVFVSKLKPGSLFSINGHVTNEAGTPLPDVLISTAAGYSTSTDTNGNYYLTGLPAGAYTLLPSLNDYTFSPPDLTVTISSDTIGLDFTGLLQSSDCPQDGTDTNGNSRSSPPAISMTALWT